MSAAGKKRARVQMRYRARGFSMIEVLVTLLVISLALLGAAGLQAYAMRQNQNSQFRTQAVFLASDLVERMEANKPGAVAGNYVLEETGSAGTLNTACATTACSPQELAEFDKSQWQNAVAATLPMSKWSVSHGGAGNPIVYEITVKWVDRRTDSDNDESGSGIGTGGEYSYVSHRTIQQ